MAQNPTEGDKRWFLTSEELLAQHPLADSPGFPSAATAPQLFRDAPGLWSSLFRQFKRETTSLFEEAYDFACAHGGKDEWPIERPEGASFNPRPARICQILFSQGRINDPNLLAAAFISSIPFESGSFESNSAESGVFDSWIDAGQAAVAKQAAQLFSKGALPQQPPAAAVTAALGLALDAVRHLHMTALTEELQHSLLDRLEPLSKLLPVSFQSPLPTLLNSSLTQQRRRLSGRKRLSGGSPS